VYWGNTGGIGQNVTITFMQQQVPATAPVCNACNAIATKRAHADGRFWCDSCFDEHNRRVIISQAEQRITASFMAVPVGSRARLFKALASVFHPDTGADAALMIALNRVRDRFPS
jgi:hypothetical protein